MPDSLFTALFATAGPNDVLFTVPDSGGANVDHTYGDLDVRSAQMAGALLAAGAERGDRIVVQVDKSIDNVALYLGCLRSGLVFVPLNTAYTAKEVQYFVNDTEAAIVVARPEAEAELASVVGQAKLLTLGVSGEGSLAHSADGATPFNDVVDVESNDMACMLYTSGTTGRSKGAMLTHGALRANGQALQKVWHFEPGDVLLHTLPIFHVHGLFVAMNLLMLNGSRMIFLHKFSVDEVLEQLPRATTVMGVPTHYTRLLADDRFDPSACATIRLFTSGSAPMTETVFREFEARTGTQICERYGMTETGIITSNPYPGDGDRVAGTVGYAMPGYEVRVVDGGVQIRGDYLFNGYWRMPEKTASEFTEDGWFKTGDVGELADDGRLTLAGRSSDMIISGGYNVYPKEIELVIDETPGVVESAVVGVPHPDFGEGVVVFVVGDPATEAEAQERCAAELARFKHPKKWIWVDALPRNAMAKVQKKKLRTDHADLFA